MSASCRDSTKGRCQHFSGTLDCHCLLLCSLLLSTLLCGWCFRIQMLLNHLKMHWFQTAAAECSTISGKPKCSPVECISNTVCHVSGYSDFNIWPPWERGVCRCGSPTGGLISMLPNNESFTPWKKIFIYPKHTEEFIIEMTVLLPGSFSGLITRFSILGFQGILRGFIQVFPVRCGWLCVLIGIFI